jgi:hypothetical protein
MNMLHYAMIGSYDCIRRLMCEDVEESTKSSSKSLNIGMLGLWSTEGLRCLGQSEKGYIMRHTRSHEPSATRHLSIHGPMAPVRPESSEEGSYAS